MQILLAPLVEEKLKKLKDRNPKLFHKIHRQLQVFRDNPKHPSLRTHKLIRTLENTWSISITMSVRMIYRIVDNNYYFINVGTHDEVYNKN